MICMDINLIFWAGVHHLYIRVLSLDIFAIRLVLFGMVLPTMSRYFDQYFIINLFCHSVEYGLIMPSLTLFVLLRIMMDMGGRKPLDAKNY